MQTENQNNTESFWIREPEAIYEAAFQACWDRLPDGAVLTLTDGSKVQILSRGEWNHEAGPDFLNAKICIHGDIQRGSIELHRRSSDYIRHGHLSDAMYDSVILHVVAENDLAGKSVENALSNIPLCCISAASLEHRAVGNVCRCRIFPYMHREQLSAFFTDAGRERIQQKSSVLLENIISNGTSSAFLQALFRAAGYKRNQQAFGELFRRFFLYPESVRSEHFSAILWGESGLLPDPAVVSLPEDCRDTASSLWENFWKLRLKDEAPIPWNRDSIRPVNTPERRLAMLCSFIGKYGLDPLPGLAGELASSSPKAFVTAMRKKILFSDPFWDFHYSFLSEKMTKRVVILGKERAETLMIDVITPALIAYSKLKNDTVLTSKAAELLRYLSAQRNNRIYKNAIRRWFPDGMDDSFLNNAEMVQGCLHIYHQYCANTAGDCVSCLLANS